ncbi:MAG: hypothetical protein IKT95_05765 [Spirochaetales bacterium]|nr:hypothetical protein [Spirochaetales bacterium]
MKRYACLFFILILLLIIPMHLAALMSHVGSGHITENNPIGLTVYGFIEDDSPIFMIETSTPVYTGRGINLDVMDASNALRYQIAPSSQALSIAGAKIGSFSVISSTANRVLTITHTPLILTNNSTVTVDWELAVSWDLNGNHQTGFCLSSLEGYSTSGREIVINLNGAGSDTVRIHDALMYFRLSSSDSVTESGDYYADVLFWVESLT